MTDTMELVRKLEAGDVSLKTTRAAAACIREMVEKIAMLEDEISTYFYPKED